MLNDSYIGRLATKILETMDPGIQSILENASPEERKAYQGFFTKDFVALTGEPYGHVYKALGWVIKELTEKPGAPIH